MLEVVEGLAQETVKAASAQLWPLSDTDVTACLRAVHRWEQSLALLKTRLIQQVETRSIPGTEGDRSVTRWLRSRLRIDPHLARELAERAEVLHRRPTIEQAILDGLLDIRQAAVIAAAVNAIPVTLNSLADETSDGSADPASDTPGTAASDTRSPKNDGLPDPTRIGTEHDGTSDLVHGLPGEQAGGEASLNLLDRGRIADDAESVLIGMAAQFSALHLRHLGTRILTHVAPELADRADEAALHRQEQRAHARRSFTLSPPTDGMVRISGTLDVEAAAIIDAALQPLCVPRPNDDRTAGQKRADALADVCRLALRTGQLPEHGGEPPQIAVTVRYDTLTRQLEAATLDSGHRVSASTARRLACDARLIPITLGSTGQILDAGRSRRLASGPLRRALVARDRGCAFPGCDRPPRWCDAHHLRPWSTGGPTNLDNLVLLCRHHHQVVHDPRQGWRIRLGRDSLPEFTRPPWVDLMQRPQRNLYHPRTKTSRSAPINAPATPSRRQTPTAWESTMRPGQETGSARMTTTNERQPGTPATHSCSPSPTAQPRPDPPPSARRANVDPWGQVARAGENTADRASQPARGRSPAAPARGTRDQDRFPTAHVSPPHHRDFSAIAQPPP